MYFSTVVQCARPTLDQRVDPGPPLGRRYDLFSWRSVARSALFWLSAALAASAQTAPPDHPSTDAEKIADALRAGPRFITKDATLLDWPTTRGGEYRVLRQGSNEWTCLPGFPGLATRRTDLLRSYLYAMDERNLGGREPNIDRVGLSYMYAGA